MKEEDLSRIKRYPIVEYLESKHGETNRAIFEKRNAHF